MDQMKLTLSFRVELINVFNDFKDKPKIVEYNYTMLVNINRLDSIDNHVQWNSYIDFKSYLKYIKNINIQ